MEGREVTPKLVDYQKPKERVYVLLAADGPPGATKPVVFGSRAACGLFYGAKFEQRLIETVVVA